jgi:lipopolysaccharide export system protein LptA
MRRWVAVLGLLAALALAPSAACAQGLDFSRGGPIQVTARDGIEWRQDEQRVIARGEARATRDKVTITADRLIAWYRKKPGAAANTASPAVEDGSSSEVYRLGAEGNVRIFTDTEQAFGEHAVYDVDQAVMVLSGRDLRLITENEVLTARDSLEYWSQKRMAVARGDAVALTKDQRRIAADTLVAYMVDATTPPSGARAAAGDPVSSGKLDRMEAFGRVSVRTPTDMATGDRAVYVPDLGIARLGGGVRITRGPNQINGAQAVVNMKTGVARLIGGGSERVRGLVLPNDPASQAPPDLAPPAPGRRP